MNEEVKGMDTFTTDFCQRKITVVKQLSRYK